MSALLYRIGHFAGRHPWRVLAAWVCSPRRRSCSTCRSADSRDETLHPSRRPTRSAPRTPSRTASPQETLYSSNVIFHAEDGITTPAAKAAVEQAVTELADGDARRRRERSLRPARSDRQQGRHHRLRDRRLRPQEVGPEDFDAADKAATRTVRDAGIQVEYDGGLGYAKGDAAPGSEKIGILVAVVVLAIAFGSLVAMSLPIVVALVGLAHRHQRHRHHVRRIVAVPKIATVVAMMIGLGVGIDYALFILARHRQNLETACRSPRRSAAPTPPPACRCSSPASPSSSRSPACRSPASR